MGKMNKIIVSYLHHKIDTLKSKLEYYKAYNSLYGEKKLEAKARVFEKMRLKKEHSSLPYSSLEYKENLKNEALNILENDHYWKKREIIQSHKRKLVNLNTESNSEIDSLYNQKLQDLENNYSSKRAEIINRYKDVDYDSIPENDKQNLERLNNKYLETKKSIDQRYSNSIKNSELKLNKKIYNLEVKLAQLKAKVANYEINSDFDLPNDVLLKVEDLSMTFGGLKAIDGLSFEVKQGEIFGLIGPNGAGKTTVFNCITRFYKATQGDVYYRNNIGKVINLNNYKVHNVIKEGIVRTFQNVELIWELTVLENLLVASHTQYRSGFFSQLINSRSLRNEEEIIKNKARKILQDLGLIAFQNVSPYGLPYGTLKRIELARTLMINPKLIILDEPAAGLNEVETQELAEIIKKIKNDYNATIFLVEHDMGLVMNICDTICAISFGKKLAIGTPKAIQKDKAVLEAYLGGVSEWAIC